MSLGYTADVHRKSAKQARSLFFKFTRESRAALDRGSCSLALKKLVLAAAWHGVASGDMAAATNKRATPITRKHTEKLQRDYLKRCSCKRR
jgi:hypothetical protein